VAEALTDPKRLRVRVPLRRSARAPLPELVLSLSDERSYDDCDSVLVGSIGAQTQPLRFATARDRAGL